MGLQVTCNDHPEREYLQAKGNGENPKWVVIWSDLYRNIQQLISSTGKVVANFVEHYVEDYVSALLSKDPNKLKVYLGLEVYELSYDNEIIILRDDSLIKMNGELYTVGKLAEQFGTNEHTVFQFDSQYDDLPKEIIDVMDSKIRLTKIGNTSGYDGHSIRTFSYFRDQLPNIFDTVASINSIKILHEDLRGKSKAPTFLKTYGGSEHGLHKTCGFSKEAAKQISNMYHELYEVSDQYTRKRLEEAAELGYVTLAFGLRLRCPLLRSTPDSKSRYAMKNISSEERTLGNAFGQSYGMLNNRAMIDFMDRVWNSPYKHDIMPIAAIHDASYYILTDDVEVVKFVNDNLIDAMQWQEDPAIAHDRVKIGAELDVCYESWATPVTIPNNATIKQILGICDNYLIKLDESSIKEKDIERDERLDYIDEEDEAYE